MSLNRKIISGHTMMEVLVVLMLLGVLASYAVPRLNNAIHSGRNQEAEQILYAIYISQMDFFDNNGGAFTTTWPGLDITLPVNPKNFGVPVLDDGTANDLDCGATTDVPYLSRMAANQGGYTLYVTTTGLIRCIPCGAGTTCAKMGYDVF